MRRPIKLWLLSVLAIQFGLSSQSYGQQDAVAVVSPASREPVGQRKDFLNNKYVNEAFGWSVTVPDGWTISDDYPRCVSFEASEKRALFGIFALNQQEREFMEKTDGEIANFWANQWLANLGSDKGKPMEMLSKESVLLPNGLNAVEIIHKIGRGQVGKSRALIFANDSGAYMLVAEAYEQAWPGFMPAFAQLVASFKMPPKTSPKTQVIESPLKPDQPDDLLHQYLYSGRLSEASQALNAALTAQPDDDRSRFCLGIVQFGLAIEHFVQTLNSHGFLTERKFGPVLSTELRELFPDCVDPKPFSNTVFRQMIETWISDLNRAEQTLASIKQDSVKLHIQPALIKLDPAGNGKPVNAVELLRMMFPQEEHDQISQFGLTLDRGDVHWLRGYLHLQAAVGEGLLAHDFRSSIETCAQQLFENVDTPYTWLLSEKRKQQVVLYFWRTLSTNDAYEVGDIWNTTCGNVSIEPQATVYLDAAAFFVGQCLESPIIEPPRFKAVLAHLEKAVENAQEMWKYILAETDDDNEWIPNPRQRGSIAVEVTQPMIDMWLETLAETQRILRGEKLIPFWRDLLQEQPKELVRGINLRKVFENPPSSTSIISWIQGIAAAPYFEEGELTEFANSEFPERINQVFGPAFPGFALWFN